MTQTTDQFIYVILSRTQTGFARTLRRVGRMKYNHSAIALDKDLKELYSFARSEQFGYLTARLVHETTDRYLVNADDIQIRAYKIPVTREQHDWVRRTIHEIKDDPKFMYNPLSVLTYPLLGGFSTYKAFSCSEFVAYVLEYLDFPIRKPLYKYRPDDLQSLLANYLCYDGKLLSFTSERTKSDNYFRPFTMHLLNDSLVAATVLLYRSLPVMFHTHPKSV